MKDRMNKMKRSIVLAAAEAGEGHIPSALSVLDILWVLYDRVADITPKNFHLTDRDRFILSKGHSSIGFYAVLVEKGFIDEATFKSFGKFKSTLGGHPDRTKVVGVEASTGSLGHGMPMAVGVAMGMKIKKAKKKVYTLVGDGECNEGTIWESALLAAHHKLDNLYCVIDYNHSGDRALNMGDIAQKFASFGWHTITINGHDHEEIFEAFSYKSEGKPVAIIANTIKGYGIKIMENSHAWHHKSPSTEEITQILKELE